MAAAELLNALRAAGARLAVRAGRVVIVGAPRELRPRLLPLAPLIGRLHKARWRQDLATWPPWRREAFEGARARQLEQGDPPDQAARWGYIEAAELQEPPAPPAPEAFEAPELPPGTDPADPVAAELLAQADVEPPPEVAAPATQTRRVLRAVILDRLRLGKPWNPTEAAEMAARWNEPRALIDEEARAAAQIHTAERAARPEPQGPAFAPAADPIRQLIRDAIRTDLYVGWTCPTLAERAKRYRVPIAAVEEEHAAAVLQVVALREFHA